LKACKAHLESAALSRRRSRRFFPRILDIRYGPSCRRAGHFAFGPTADIST
jgi:hypothetical protein